MDALSAFSLISKFMGRYPEDWKKHLKGVSQRGYNMVHFTPLVERGDSNSPYSIYDQLGFDPTIFPNGEKDVAQMIDEMETDYGMLGMTDVVLNHTANNSKWLEEHPEAGYNVETAPWLESALELENALLNFGENLEKLGLPTSFEGKDGLEGLYKVMDGMKEHVIDKIRLWEFYPVDVERNADAILEAWTSGTVKALGEDHASSSMKGWSIKQKAEFFHKECMPSSKRLGGRYSRQVNPKQGAALLSALYGHNDSSEIDTTEIRRELTDVLNEVNVPFYEEFNADLAEIMDQVFNRIKYLRVDDHGPKLGPISDKSKIVETYFTRLPLNATTKKHNPKALSLVNNGWIWAADAMRDNAGPDSKAYLRREVIVWQDCVKLRYGSSPSDNPFLWEYMGKYTRLMAKYFAAFRIDNCHSTPIHVAEHMLSQARKVRPNLAVFAELFTGSEEMDYVFVKRLGLSSLIREAMQAWSTGEVSRLVHRHGGRPIGSFDIDVPSAASSDPSSQSPDSAGSTSEKSQVVRHIRESPVHALFMDCTHDNEVPAQKRDARDTLSNAALVSLCSCAIGSVMGYDEVYPKLVDLVHETRTYTSISSERDVKIEGGNGGIGGIKKLLNQLHVMMGNNGYNETHIHHEGEYVTVHRMDPSTRKGIFLIAHTAFPGYGSGHGGLSPVHLAGTKAKLLGSWKLEVDASEEAKKEALRDPKLLKGLPNTVSELTTTKIEVDGENTTISLAGDFPPGSIALFETWVPSAELSEGLVNFVASGASEAFAELDLVDLNFVLYRCDAEEKDFSGGKDGVYDIPGHGPLVYAGLQGWWSVLEDIIKYNNLGHPLCNHLRDGQWALDYVVGRLERMAKQNGFDRLHKPAVWLKERFDAVRSLPSFLLPRYFAMIVEIAYNAAWSRGIDLMADDVRHGQGFLQALAMVSVQQVGYTKSASLWPQKQVPSLAAGLPHFAVDWARCWGRDVFISLPGLLLGTGRFAEAKEHIVAFASVVKHGLIPNLLSGGKLPRYNSRDSPWFFLQAIQDYVQLAPEGDAILQAKVPRRFLPYDDTWFEFDDPRAYSKTSTIEEIIQEILQRHASGISFREANAGPGLDMQMSSEGFNIEVKVDWETGLIFGGSQSNCGTWMDKMGESEKAGSKGVPGTPRDGAAIEITGLAFSALKWVSELQKQGKFNFDGVDNGQSKISYSEWASKIQANFERCYYVPTSPTEDKNFDVNTSIVNRRGMYKDLYKSGKEYEDYQLRANFPIAMTVAPALFTPQRALEALELADKTIRGPQGMATLDPSDMNYRPYYNNSEDSTDFATSKGRNYHQGPEWVWPTGFFLRAFLKFDLMRRKTKEEKTEAFQQVTQRLKDCKKALGESPWAGLTELTNKNGEYCGDSVSFSFFPQTAKCDTVSALLLTTASLRLKLGLLGA